MGRIWTALKTRTTIGMPLGVWLGGAIAYGSLATLGGCYSHGYLAEPRHISTVDVNNDEQIDFIIDKRFLGEEKYTTLYDNRVCKEKNFDKERKKLYNLKK